MQGLDASIIDAAQEGARQALEAHIEQMAAPTVGDVIGGRKAIIREAPVLPSAMPYARVVEGARYAALPAALQPTITFGLGADILGTPLAQIQYPWAKLNNRKVTLSFRPATQADEDALHALLPEGEITDISQLPSSIPAYLIKVVPELKVEGQTVLAGAPMNLGEELAFRYSVRDPIHGLRHYPNKVVAGSYLAVAVVGGGVAVGSLQEAQSRLEATRGTLAEPDEALLAGLTREDLLGDMFYAGLLGYFAQYQALGHLSALSQGAHFQLATSAGTYGYVPRVSYFFGLPHAVIPGGIEMDLDRVAHTSSVDRQGSDVWRQFNFQLGALSSALEHAVPEQMFASPDNPGEAVSAVRALQKAAAQGQRIYHITPANQNIALPDLRHSAQTLNDIRSALAVGREVIVHTDPIEVTGWRGTGYVIFDPEVGDGAWRIEGGASGSWIYALIGAFFSAVLDGLLAKYRSPTSMFGPRDEITFSKVANFAAKALTMLAFAHATYATVANDKLGTDQKILTILAHLGSAIGIMKATSWIMASALMFPVSVLVAAAVAVAIAALTLAILTVLVASKGNRDRYAFG